MKVTDTFFAVKKDWSIAKDDLLRCYIRPYMNKLFHSGKIIVYVDCFAGAGKFGSDEFVEQIDIKSENVPISYGSPLIALKEISRAYADSTMPNRQYVACFIENEYHKQLAENIEKSQFSDMSIHVLPVSYQEGIRQIIDKILSRYKKPNLLCYIDPFGVKYLQIDLFKEMKSLELNSFELLINFNSFGFFRFACAADNVSVREPDISEHKEIVERDMSAEKKESRLTIFDEILGTTTWRKIIEDYQDEKFDGYKAEENIARLYRKQLKKVLGFRYVLSIPIRINESCHPKYRMVFATNSADGAVIMGKVMNKRQKYLHDYHEISKDGGCGLFDIDDLRQGPSIEDCILEILEGNQEWGGTEFFAEFYDKYFLTSRLETSLKQLEKEGVISIRRDPAFKKNGEKRTFLSESRECKLYINLN
ncbi:MAG: three-Cys-motif partner protein TcmP [Peptostreptococcaceae bacterium]|nr:three-Cys-motif partner protein TcmP [Peptostreptococcaceae bacterium]